MKKKKSTESCCLTERPLVVRDIRYKNTGSCFLVERPLIMCDITQNKRVVPVETAVPNIGGRI